MKQFLRLGHNLVCGRHKEESRQAWSGWSRFLWALITATCVPLGLALGGPSGDPPNSPMGVAKGIFPGRVTWIRDTNATPWDGNTGYWWQDTTGINQAAVDRMFSASLRALTGAGSDAKAWGKVFAFYNSNHGRGSAGYADNERIAIKINLNNDYDFLNYSRDCGSNTLANASAQTVRALLRQLVNKAGVPQTNIALYDAVRSIPRWLYQSCQTEFSSVQWFGCDGYDGQVATWVTNSSSYSVPNGCGGHLLVPRCVSEATYLINLPLLKGHDIAGVTLSAKNHYGSIPYRDHSALLAAWQTNAPLYSMLVDLMGSRQLGGKTILYVNDALFGNVNKGLANSTANCAFSNLFNGQWSASIFMSFDPVAIDSVGVDFLYTEFGWRLGMSFDPPTCPATNCDHYLHEAALANQPSSGTVYQPDGVRLGSLGVHEHWNNATDKQYTRNLSPDGTGIELLALHQLPPATLTIVSPTNGAVFEAGNNIPLAAAATTNCYRSVSRVDFYADGTLVGTSTNPPFGSVWTNPAAGLHALTAMGADLDGYCVTSAIVNVHIPGVSVVITNPVSGTTVSEGTNLAVQARALSDYAPISEVDFYANGGLIGATLMAPFGVIWSNAAAGNWGLSAATRDACGLTATSAVVNVCGRPDIRVAVIQPSPGSVSMQGDNLTLSTTATSPFTEIVRVDYYANGSPVGSATASPCVLTWSNAPPGLCALTAVATDSAGFSATSSVVNVTIKPSQPRVAGTLYVDLRATDFLPDSATWTNHGALGDFPVDAGFWPPPALDSNVAGTAVPGVLISNNRFVGPRTVPDIEGSSDRSIEVWALATNLFTSHALVSSGSELQNASFSACYGLDPRHGAFLEYNDPNDPHNAGWYLQGEVPGTGVWHHFAYVYDGATCLKVYVDGALSLLSLA